MQEKIAKLQKLKILFVEDEQELLNIISDTLGKLGIRYRLASNGKEGLEILESDPEIDLVVTDINMPVMNGLDMIKQIRKSGKDIACIVMSAHSEEDFINKSKELGVKDYILKPFDFIKFIDIVSKIDFNKS